MKQFFKGALLIAAAIVSGFGSFAGNGITKTVKVDDANIVYRVYGNKGGTPLVLLAALGFTMDSWDPAVVDGLAKQSTVILFDGKGVGGSTGKTPVSIAEMAQDAVSFVKSLGYSKVNLLGFSMGGFVAQQIAEAQPQLVNKLILVGTGPQGAEGLSEIGQKLSAAQSLSPEEQFLGGFFAPDAQSRELGKASLGRIVARKGDHDAALSKESLTAEVTAVFGWAQPDPAGFEKAKSVSIPVLIVHGQYDFFLPVSNPVKLYETMPNARLVLLPDAGHASFFQYPELFLQEAGYFLRN